jgi:SAM-dependent methyltransferase
MVVEDVLDEIAARFRDDPESRRYLETHALRYPILLGLVGEALGRVTSTPPRVLDAGPSYELEAMRRLWPRVHVDSLGFEDPRLMPPRAGERHFEVDLAGAADESTWPKAEPYDLVVCAEVIEHLHAAPRAALRMLASLLRSGGTMLVQTPNGAALLHRLRLLLGKNPFEPIREDLHHAGHFHEYTVAELVALCREAGLEPTRVELHNYFLTGTRKNRLLVRAGGLLPPRLRQGITLAATKA